MPRAATQSAAASTSALAASTSLRHSNRPKKPVLSWWVWLWLLSTMAMMRPTISPSRLARKYAPSACSKKGFFFGLSLSFIATSNGGTQSGSPA